MFWMGGRRGCWMRRGDGDGGMGWDGRFGKMSERV